MFVCALLRPELSNWQTAEQQQTTKNHVIDDDSRPLLALIQVFLLILGLSTLVLRNLMWKKSKGDNNEIHT